MFWQLTRHNNHYIHRHLNIIASDVNHKNREDADKSVFRFILLVVLLTFGAHHGNKPKGRRLCGQLGGRECNKDTVIT